MENKEKNNVGVIVILSVVIVILAILCVLFATNTISLKSGSTNNGNLSNNNANNDNSSIDNTNANIKNTNTTIDNYVGKWFLSGSDYSYIEIKKNADASGYKIDILVNKMADYKDLELHCATNSGACYFSADSEHNYSIMMTNDVVTVLPDYSSVGYWNFNK